MIELFADIVVALVALSHVGFLVLEMFLWEKPLGLKIFRHTAEKAAVTRVLAANQGLYNGFLAAGLLWGLAPDVNAGEIYVAPKHFKKRRRDIVAACQEIRAVWPALRQAA